MKRPALVLFVAVTAAVTACGHAGKDREAALKEASATAAAASALVPDTLKSKVKFKADVTDGGRVVAVVPDGWVPAMMKGEIQPPKDVDLGFFTRMHVSHTCQGECKPTDDWEARVVSFYGTFAADVKADRDERLPPNGRVMTKKMASSDTVDTIYTQWSKGASVFYMCRFELSAPAVPLQAAFDKACQGMIPLRWDAKD